MTMKEGEGVTRLTSKNVSGRILRSINVRRNGSTKVPETDMDRHTYSAFILASEVISEPTQNAQGLQFE